jgi:hypothetical protein
MAASGFGGFVRPISGDLPPPPHRFVRRLHRRWTAQLPPPELPLVGAATAVPARPVVAARWPSP